MNFWDIKITVPQLIINVLELIEWRLYFERLRTGRRALSRLVLGKISRDGQQKQPFLQHEGAKLGYQPSAGTKGCSSSIRPYSRTSALLQT